MRLSGLSVLSQAQSRSQSPRYSCPVVGTGNKDLWDKAFRHDRILGLPVLLRMSGGMLYPRGPCWPFLPLNKSNEDSGVKSAVSDQSLLVTCTRITEKGTFFLKI